MTRSSNSKTTSKTLPHPTDKISNRADGDSFSKQMRLRNVDRSIGLIFSWSHLGDRSSLIIQVQTRLNLLKSRSVEFASSWSATQTQINNPKPSPFVWIIFIPSTQNQISNLQLIWHTLYWSSNCEKGWKFRIFKIKFYWSLNFQTLNFLTQDEILLF